MTSGKMVDLDALADHCNSTVLRCFVGQEFPDSILAMIAELRAARKIIGVLPKHTDVFCDLGAISRAIKAYHAAINHGTKP